METQSNNPKRGRGRPRKLPVSSDGELEVKRLKRKYRHKLLKNDWVNILIPGYSETEMDILAFAEAQKDSDVENGTFPVNSKRGRPCKYTAPPEDWEASLFDGSLESDLNTEEERGMTDDGILRGIWEGSLEIDEEQQLLVNENNCIRSKLVSPGIAKLAHERLRILRFRLICDAPPNLDVERFLEKMSSLGIRERSEKIYKGISLDEALELRQLFGLDNLEFSLILNCAVSTFKRHPHDYLLSQNASDRLMALITVFEEGYRAFNNRNDFFVWLRSPLAALQNDPPFSLLGTIVGMEEVKFHIVKYRINLKSK